MLSATLNSWPTRLTPHPLPPPFSRPVPSPRLSFSRVAPYILSVDAKAQLFNEETTLLQNRAARTIFGRHAVCVCVFMRVCVSLCCW